MQPAVKLSKNQREANIFASFIRFHPLFADEPILDWSQPKPDPPDILCVTDSRKNVGVELRAWLHENEMAAGMAFERREESLMEALGDQGYNTHKHVYWVWLHPKPSARVRDQDRVNFRNEALARIAEMDAAMGREESWSPHGLFSSDFTRYPLLAATLSGIQCFPRKTWRDGRFVMQDSIPGQPWIHLPARGDCYSQQTMLGALYEAIDEKRDRYHGRPAGLEAFYLLIHYDQAVCYNSPVETPTFKFEDAARLGSAHIAGNPGVFDKIFLYLAIRPGQAVFRLY